ncbi:MAG: aminopeptidase, partial [Lysobacteraceae bacterium]
MNRSLPKTPPKTLLLTFVAIATLSACQREAEAPPAPSPAPAPATQAPVFAFKDAIDAADFGEHVRVLASDAFEGRAPGSPGEDKTVEYLKAQFERMGLKPGNGDSYFQTVPMMETTADESTMMSIDVKGKTVVMFGNDPGFHSNDASLVDGRRMTYYGRWTYKFEEAGRKGAAAALIVHDTEGASYGWDVVKNSWTGAQYDLRAADDPAPRVPLQGWISGDVAKAL